MVDSLKLYLSAWMPAFFRPGSAAWGRRGEIRKLSLTRARVFTSNYNEEILIPNREIRDDFWSGNGFEKDTEFAWTLLWGDRKPGDRFYLCPHETYNVMRDTCNLE